MAPEPLAAPGAVVQLEVDHTRVSVPCGSSVLAAAAAAGVYVPSLCSHPELSPFGGCRLCAVEIAGMRGYPLACSTVVSDNMEVTTDTQALREMRAEILQLILSEHPSSCLLCGEQEDCRRSLTTIRKAGVSTGCRSCPRDGDCELQRVAEGIGVETIGYPITYKGLEPEHDDPFYDRDYNLCILCGRCVRMCDEVRGAGVLAFKYRGSATVVGPAFGSSHVEAGCEFCGACVSVCPTGALADKVSKWDGRPDGVVTSTCPFCGVGCRLEVAHKDGRLVSATGAFDREINDGQLCVRGRFCLPETAHHYERARKPMLRKAGYFREVDWDEALGAAAHALGRVSPDELLVLVSGDLSNESLYAAQRLVRDGLDSGGVDSTARRALPGGPALWSRLFSLPVSLAAVATADIVLVAGLDTRFSFSVVGVQVRRALRRGATLVAVDARESNLARMAQRWRRTGPGEEAEALAGELEAWGGDGTLAVVAGPRVFECPGAARLAVALEAIAAHDGVTVVPLVHGANTRGALELGALAGVLPGPRLGEGSGFTLGRLQAGQHPRVLYLAGEARFATRPDAEVVIAQDLYLPPFDVDVFLPAASFAEADGTLTSIEGRVQRVVAVESPASGAGGPRADWRVFSDLARELGDGHLTYPSDGAVRRAIRAELPGWPASEDRTPRRMTPFEAPLEARGDGTVEGAGRFVLVPEGGSFRHRGVDLADVVEGLGELRLEDGVRLNPHDLARLGVEPEGTVTVKVDGRAAVFAARPDPGCPRGAAYLAGAEGAGFGAAPVRARISKGGARGPGR
jgi:predicted molibdopterin-dependent oxidoreductase YjgC